jgi:PIN domain nuclease of toxin-antitoxin system
MMVLLDTHAFLWAVMDSDRLSDLARDLIDDPANDLCLSAASAFEIAVKAAKGHLLLPEDPDSYIRTRVATMGLRPLSVTVEHAAAAAMLPPIHADPWDRLLVAQARLEALPILTADRLIKRYDVETIW